MRPLNNMILLLTVLLPVALGYNPYTDSSPYMAYAVPVPYMYNFAPYSFQEAYGGVQVSPQFYGQTESRQIEEDSDNALIPSFRSADEPSARFLWPVTAPTIANTATNNNALAAFLASLNNNRPHAGLIPAIPGPQATIPGINQQFPLFGKPNIFGGLPQLPTGFPTFPTFPTFPKPNLFGGIQTPIAGATATTGATAAFPAGLGGLGALKPFNFFNFLGRSARQLNDENEQMQKSDDVAIVVDEEASLDMQPELKMVQSFDRDGKSSFSYSGGPSERSEFRDENGVVTGSFKYLDGHGNVQNRQYVADQDGFKVVGSDIPQE